MAHGVDFVFPCGDPSHRYLLSTFQFCLFDLLVSQSNFIPMASYVPKGLGCFLGLGLPSQDHFCSGPLLFKKFLSAKSS